MADLCSIHPELVARITRVLDALSALGFPMRITDGVRTMEQQAAIYAQGRTTPGRIVTYADGVTHRSNHQVKADGYGHAVDCAFVGSDGDPSWAESWPWNAYGACVVAVGLTWGGNWRGKKRDRPHCELP